MSETSRKPVAVIGAGIAGLTAANFLRRHGVPIVLFEGGKQVAGMAGSFVDDRGFHYDFGAHFITNRLAAAVGVSALCREVPYYGETFLVNGKQYSYPFGLLASPRYVASALKTKLTPSALRRHSGDKESPSALDWFRAEFGRALADDVSLPVLEAWSGVPADQLASSVGEKLQNSILKTIYLRLSSRWQGRAVALGYSHEAPEGPSVYHVYPEHGVSQVCQRLLDGVCDAVEMESPVEQIQVEDGRVVAVRVAGRVREVAAVVSTVPAPVLPKLVIGTDALEPLRRFRYRPMTFVCMRFEKRGILSDTVLWTAGGKYPFFRLTETPLSMPWLAPAGKTLITADIGCQVGDETWTMPDDALGEKCVDAMAELFPGVRQHYSGCRVLRTPIAYPVYLREYESDRRQFAEGTGVDGLYSIGRNGEFAHILMEDVYWRTLKRMNQLVGTIRATGSRQPVSPPSAVVGPWATA